MEACSLEHVGWGQGCEQAAERTGLWEMTWGIESHLLPGVTGICLANAFTAVSHVGKEPSVPAQAPLCPTASWSRRAGWGGSQGGGGGPDDRNLLSSPSELLALGPGHQPDPQILPQDQAVICSSSGSSMRQAGAANWRPGRWKLALGCTLFSLCGIFFNEWSQYLKICRYWIKNPVSLAPLRKSEELKM